MSRKLLKEALRARMLPVFGPRCPTPHAHGSAQLILALRSIPSSFGVRPAAT